MQTSWAAPKSEQHWLDFGTNRYTPYALQGGATDMHMPFVVQVTLPFAFAFARNTAQLELTWCVHATLVTILITAITPL